jgi:hypothetical protein
VSWFVALAALALVTAACVLPWPGTPSGAVEGFGTGVSTLLGHSPLDVHRAVPVMIIATFAFLILVAATALVTVLSMLRPGRAAHWLGAVLACLLTFACGVVAVPSHPALTAESGPFVGVAGFLLLALWHAWLAPVHRARPRT